MVHYFVKKVTMYMQIYIMDAKILVHVKYNPTHITMLNFFIKNK